MLNVLYKIDNPGKCPRIHRGLTTTVNFMGINVMADSDSIKNTGKIKFKFCAVCGDLYPNKTKFFHSKKGKLKYVCLKCDTKTLPRFCFVCGKPISGRVGVCMSCQRNKYTNGRYVLKQMPVAVVLKIRRHIGHIKTTQGATSQICSQCGFILPLTELYYQRNSRKKNGFRGNCKKCRTGEFREVAQPRTKREWSEIRKKRRRALVQFSSWKTKLFADEIKKGDKGRLQAKCKYCDRWFYPTLIAAENRYRASIGQLNAENGLYCSPGCKRACPTFNQHWSEKEQKRGTSRETNALLRKLVLNRDGHQCTKCGAKGKRVELHCHHIMPATQNPMIANDPDNCVTLCKACHIEAHKGAGCGYYDLRCG
jgi:hypothetical protein